MLARTIAILLIATSAQAFEAPANKTSAWVSSTVSVEVKAPDGTSKKFSGIPWSLNLSVLDAMRQVEGLKFSADWYYSFGDWLIISIDGAANQGAGKANWMFCVNGSPSNVGVSSYNLAPNASVTWLYSADYPAKCP